jgi:CRP/FNR family transcriptional regulator
MMQTRCAPLELPRTPPPSAGALLRLVGEAAPDGDAARISATLDMVARQVPVQRSMLHVGEAVHRAGQAFTHVYVLNAGFVKVVNSAIDGRVQLVGLNFRGDWLGFDGIATGRYICDAVALDTGEIWALRYDALLRACAAHLPLLSGLHAEMSRAITRGRDSMLSRCTLPVDARVADFLRDWARALSRQGQRADQITLRMTRAEIGNYLGMTLESVSRALSTLARDKLIRFAGKGRREILIPDPGALDSFILSQTAVTARS